MLDLDNIPTSAQIMSDLPFPIAVGNYCELDYLRRLLNNDLGLKDVYITEVGSEERMIVGLVHLDTASHNQLVLVLDKYYEKL